MNEHETEKKDLGACLEREQRQHFFSFAVSTADGFLGKEGAKILLKKLSIQLGKSGRNPTLKVAACFVNTRMSFCYRQRSDPPPLSRIPTSKLCNHLLQWENKAGLGLFPML